MEQLTKNPNVVLVIETLSRVARWWGLAVAGLAIGVAGGLLAYDQLPKQYEAQTVLLVTPPRIPKEYLRSTVTGDMGVRLQALEEAVLSRAYMNTLIDEVIEPTADTKRREFLSNQVAARLDTSSNIDRYSGTGTVTLTYQDSNPQQAADILNFLANRYIEENVRIKRNQADTVVDTLDDIAGNVGAELEAKQREIAQLKSRYLYSLPENREANVRMLDSSRIALQAKERDIEMTRGRLELLESQQRQGRKTSVGDVKVDPSVARLQKAEEELAVLLNQYTEQHPKVSAKKQEVLNLRAEVRAKQPATTTGQDEITSPIDAQIVMARRELTRLQQEQQVLKDDIAKYQFRLEQTPIVEQQLTELSLGLDQLKNAHDRYLTKSEDAKGSRQVEEAQMGEQFEIVEKAYAPTTPISPNRIRILMLSVIGALGLFLAPIVLKSVLAPRVSSKAGVEAITEVPVLISIGEANTKPVKQQKFRRWALNFASIAGAAAIVVAAVGYMKAWF